MQLAPPSNTLFRAEAVLHHRQGGDEPVLPGFSKPPAACWHLLLGFLLVAAATLCQTRLPVYASGSVVVVSIDRGIGHTADYVALDVMPPADLHRVRVGQVLLVQSGQWATAKIHGQIVAIHSQIISPADLRRRLAFDGPSSLAITRPSALVVVRWTQSESGPAAGVTYPAKVEIGSRRALSLILPINKPISE